MIFEFLCVMASVLLWYIMSGYFNVTTQFFFSKMKIRLNRWLNIIINYSLFFRCCGRKWWRFNAVGRGWLWLETICSRPLGQKSPDDGRQKGLKARSQTKEIARNLCSKDGGQGGNGRIWKCFARRTPSRYVHLKKNIAKNKEKVSAKTPLY